MIKNHFALSFLLLFLLCHNVQATETVVLQLKWLHSFQFAGYYVAKEKGFYAEENLNVQIQEPTIEMYDFTEPLLNGSVQYGVADAGLLIQRLNDKPLVILASIFQHNPLVLVTLKKSGIVSPHQLVGKKVMSRPNDDSPFYAMYYEAGIDPNSIIRVPHSFNLDDFINGKVDAISVYLTDQIDELRKKNIAFNIIDPRTYGINFLGDNLYTTEQEIAEHPERVQRFLRASLKGWDYALKHPNEAIDIILKKYNTRKRLSLEHLTFEAQETIKMILPDSVPLGSTDIKRFERPAQTYLQLGLVKSTERLKGFVYRQSINASQFTLQEQAWLRAHPVLKVGVHSDFPPFEWLDNKNNYIGLSADYMALISDYLGIKFEYVSDKDWYKIIEKAKNREIDILANVNRTLDREKYLDFTEPYLNYPMVIIDNSKSTYIKDLKQLAGKKVIVNSGYFIEELLRHDHPELKLITAKNTEDALKRLNNDEVDAYIGNAVSAYHEIKQHGLFNLRITGETEYRRQSSIAVTKNNKELLSLLNKALNNISPLERNSIENRWLSVQIETKSEMDWIRLSKYLAVILVFILFMIYWNLRLRSAIQVSKSLEQALIEKENRLRTIINVCLIPLALNDENQYITFINPEFTKCFGYTLEDIPTLSIWWLKAYPDPVYRQHVKNQWFSALEKAKQDNEFIPQEVTIRCKDDSTRIVLISASSLENNFKDTHLVILYDLTMRKLNEIETQRSLNLLKTVITNIPMRVFWKDLNSYYLGANDLFVKDAGLSSVEELINKDDSAFIWKNEASIYQADDRLVMSTAVAKLNYEEQQTTPDGNKMWLRTSKVPLYDETNQVIGVLGVYEDITERKKIEEKLSLAASVFANTQEGIVITDVNGMIIDANKAFCQITGYSLEEILGKNPSMFQSGLHNAEFYKELWQSIANEHYWQGEVWNRRKNGEVYAEWLTITAVTNEHNEITGYIGTSSDISLLKQREQQIEQLAHYDLLTGIPNRILLIDRMQLAIAQAKRNDNLLAVCYLDLDGFELVNERLGHKVGDQLLIEITNRMKHTLREEDTIARLGGDEFVFLLQDLNCVEDCEYILNRLLKAINKPTLLSGESIVISASIGISIYPEDDNSPEILLRHTSQAMYQTKQEGKNSFHIYNIELDKQMYAHRTALNRIELALENGEFELYFQPKVDTHKGVVFGAEALIRWQHLERGLVMPKEFLPLIENNEFANRLDIWVINNALEYIAHWQTLGLSLKISINISARSLQSPDFVEILHEALLRQPSVNPNCFELEILETEVLNDLHKTSKVITACQSFGIQFALDDFGTGYSSLSYLRHLPVQTLKIDQSFVRDMLEDENDLAIVRSVIGLAEFFNRQVIAEGVESIEHGNVLRSMGCELLQGYAIAKPMPAKTFERWLKDWQMPREWQQAAIKQ